MKWTQGIPTPEAVATHEALHPTSFGACWLIIDDTGDGALRRCGVQLSRLHVATERDAARWSTALSPLVAGEVAIGNGLSYWQSLASCRWAARSRYMPVTAEGLPIDYAGPRGPLP